MLRTVERELGAVREWNPTDHDRHCLSSFMLECPQGAYLSGPVFVDKGVQRAVAQVVPVGARWPDGSVRFLEVRFRSQLRAKELREAKIIAGKAVDTSASAFVWTWPMVAAFQALGLGVYIDGHIGAPISWTAIEDGDAAKAYLATFRVSTTPIWVEMVLEVFSGRDFVYLTVRYGASDPSTSDITHQIPATELRVAGFAVVARPPSKAVAVKAIGGNITAVTLDAGGRWGDGQAQVARLVLLAPGGDLSDLAAEADLGVEAVQSDRKGWGLWGAQILAPEAVDAKRAAQLAVNSWKAPRGTIGPWETCGPHGCGPYPGAQGDQPDFGAACMQLEHLGWPQRLPSVRRSVDQESCRPTTFRGADGKPFRHAEHPGSAFWDSHCDVRISEDKLGKAKNLDPDADCRPSGVGTPWRGHDTQHESVQHLVAFYLATGDRMTRRMIDDRCEVWLAQVRVDSGSPVLDHVQAAREVGRTLLAGAQLYLATGRQDIAKRLHQRVRRVNQDRVHSAGPLSPICVMQPDPRELEGKVYFWAPWQEAQAAMGLDAVAQTVGDDLALQMAENVATMVVRFGIWQEGGQWTGGASMAWTSDGEPSDNRRSYGGYLLWMAPAVLICRRAAMRKGDSDLVERCNSILAQLAQDREGDPWRRNEWLAVR